MLKYTYSMMLKFRCLRLQARNERNDFRSPKSLYKYYFEMKWNIDEAMSFADEYWFSINEQPLPYKPTTEEQQFINYFWINSFTF